MSTIKLVAVGNSWVGKTSLLYTYFAGMFPLENKPIVFDISALHVEVDGQQCLLTPWDTAGTLREYYNNNYITCRSR